MTIRFQHIVRFAFLSSVCFLAGCGAEALFLPFLIGADINALSTSVYPVGASDSLFVAQQQRRDTLPGPSGAFSTTVVHRVYDFATSESRAIPLMLHEFDGGIVSGNEFAAIFIPPDANRDAVASAPPGSYLSVIDLTNSAETPYFPKLAIGDNEVRYLVNFNRDWLLFYAGPTPWEPAELYVYNRRDDTYEIVQGLDFVGFHPARFLEGGRLEGDIWTFLGRRSTGAEVTDTELTGEVPLPAQNFSRSSELLRLNLATGILEVLVEDLPFVDSVYYTDDGVYYDYFSIDGDEPNDGFVWFLDYDATEPARLYGLFPSGAPDDFTIHRRFMGAVDDRLIILEERFLAVFSSVNVLMLVSRDGTEQELAQFPFNFASIAQTGYNELNPAVVGSRIVWFDTQQRRFVAFDTRDNSTTSFEMFPAR